MGHVQVRKLWFISFYISPAPQAGSIRDLGDREANTGIDLNQGWKYVKAKTRSGAWKTVFSWCFSMACFRQTFSHMFFFCRKKNASCLTKWMKTFPFNCFKLTHHPQGGAGVRTHWDHLGSNTKLGGSDLCSSSFFFIVLSRSWLGWFDDTIVTTEIQLKSILGKKYEGSIHNCIEIQLINTFIPPYQLLLCNIILCENQGQFFVTTNLIPKTFSWVIPPSKMLDHSKGNLLSTKESDEKMLTRNVPHSGHGRASSLGSLFHLLSTYWWLPQVYYTWSVRYTTQCFHS